jgi:hypothetical protein
MGGEIRELGDTPKPPAGGLLLHLDVTFPLPRWERVKERVRDTLRLPAEWLRTSAHP